MPVGEVFMFISGRYKMGVEGQMKFSIIIPTFNEENEIFSTLTALTNIDYQNKEIIVVDDSSDNTSKIIEKYFGESVTLINPKQRKGRCEARNVGISRATGDILIILNADVLLPKDFISRIKVHYDQGFDSVTVMADVKNLSKCYARYVDALSLKKEQTGQYRERKITHKGIYWSEGFSVRRHMALKTNLFPTGYSVPIEAGEDVEFVNLLRNNQCKGMIDETLRVEHIAPDTLTEFWRIRKGRGAGTPQIRLFINKWSFQKVFFVLLAKCVLRCIFILLVVPIIVYNYQLTKYSSQRSITEVLKFCFCNVIELIAFMVGEIGSFTKILRQQK
jgi:glycosyltransferase involved in cell wall biosynthesis